MKNLALINRKLGIAFLVQILLVALLWWPKGPANAGKKSFFDAAELSPLSEINIWEKPDAAHPFVLRKVEGSWTLADQDGYPADQKRVDELLKHLENFNPGVPVVQTHTSHERLEVSDTKFQRKVTFLMDGQKEAKDGFYLGTSPQFRKVHIRRLNQKEVYTTAALATTDLPIDSKEWIQKKILNLNSENISSIEVKRGSETLLFTRREEEVTPKEPKEKDGAAKDNASAKKAAPVKESHWFVSTAGSSVEKRVDKTKFDANLRKLCDLSLTEVLGKTAKPQFGMNAPQATIKITLKSTAQNPAEKVLMVGSLQGNNYVVHQQDSPFYVSVFQFQLKDLLESKAADFLEKNS